MPSKQKYVDEVRQILDSVPCEHATRFDQEYCFDSVVDQGHVRIAIKISMTIDNVDTRIRNELSRICPILRCTPLIVGEKTRKRQLHDGVVHTRGTVPAINLETLRRILEEKEFPFILAKKGGIYVMVNGSKLKAAREAKDYSRGDIAEEIGLSRRAIYEYERGTMNPTIEIAMLLEKLLGTKIIEPLDILQLDSVVSHTDIQNELIKKRSYFAQNAIEVLSRIGRHTTLAHDAPFDILTTLRQNVILSSLKQQLRSRDEEELHFLDQLAEVLNEHPVIIVPDRSKEEIIHGIPIVSLKELLSIQKPEEFMALIRSRRGA